MNQIDEGFLESPKAQSIPTKSDLLLEHAPPAGPEQENNTRDLHAEASEVINRLIKLPDEDISKKIKEISYWLSIWKKYVVAVPNWSVFLAPCLAIGCRDDEYNAAT